MSTVKDGINRSYDAYKKDYDKKTADQVAALPRPGGVAQRKGLEKLEDELRLAEADAFFIAAVKLQISMWDNSGYPPGVVAQDLLTLVGEIPHG